MGDDARHLVSGGPMIVAVPLALLAGLLSFFSPCVLPLLPGYISYTTGLSGEELADPNAVLPRRRMVAGASLFVLGFSTVFVGLGVAASSVGRWFVAEQRLFTVILGCTTILLGLAYLGSIPILKRDLRVHRVPGIGLAAAPVLGFLFGLGWQPCVGPTLGAIMVLASYVDAVRGGVLLGAYSLGLGAPFIAAALAWRRATIAIRAIRVHQRWVTAAGGGLLILIGVAILTGWWDYLLQWVQVHLAGRTSAVI